jgi:menaquinone-dependent protoporphyrinogen oxidase
VSNIEKEETRFQARHFDEGAQCMRVLVTAASKHGATLGIAEVIAEELTEHGLSAEAKPVEDASAVGQYDAVVLGSAIYFGHWLKAAVDFADANFQVLSERPLWLFSSGPVEEESSAASSVESTSPIPSLTPQGHRVFLGALDKSQLGLVERSVVRAVHGKYGDFRDWGAVQAWARDIALALKGRQSEAQR